MATPRKSWFPRKYDRAEIVRLYLEVNGDRGVVAERLGMLRGTVCRILQAEGFGVGKGRPPTYQLPRDEVVTRYLAGESCRQIALDFDVDPEVVRMRLRRWKVTRRIGHAGHGEANHAWRGGQTEERERSKDMHYYRRQSYEVAAICLGQPLPQGMVIHHLDENWRNNQPQNMMIFPSQSAHAQFHWQLEKRHRAGLEVDAIHLALENGGLVLPQPPAPIQLPLGTTQSDPSRKRQRMGRPRKESKPVPA